MNKVIRHASQKIFFSLTVAVPYASAFRSFLTYSAGWFASEKFQELAGLELPISRSSRELFNIRYEAMQRGKPITPPPPKGVGVSLA